GSGVTWCALPIGQREGPGPAAGGGVRRPSGEGRQGAAATRGTPRDGAERKRRRRPRLPAPPSRVTLLGEPVQPRAVGRRHLLDEGALEAPEGVRDRLA